LAVGKLSHNILPVLFTLQCTEVELLRIRYRTHHEVGVSHEQISTEALNTLRERMRINGQADQM
jgi:hypothetical protein